MGKKVQDKIDQKSEIKLKVGKNSTKTCKKQGAHDW